MSGPSATRRVWRVAELSDPGPAEVVAEECSAAEQHAVITCTERGPCVTVAGPGTGKTRTLVERVGEDLQGPRARVLVVSFTKRAHTGS